jgi:hypothetical protein
MIQWIWLVTINSLFQQNLDFSASWPTSDLNNANVICGCNTKIRLSFLTSLCKWEKGTIKEPILTITKLVSLWNLTSYWKIFI